MQLNNITAYFLGQFYPWDSRRNAAVAVDNGMRFQSPSKANWWNFENLDNYQTGIHDFFGYLKYGYGRMAAQISVDIRNGVIGRNDAMLMVRRRDGFFPDTYMGKPTDWILDYLRIDRRKFIGYCNHFMNSKLFVQKKLEWGEHLTLHEFAETAI